MLQQRQRPRWQTTNTNLLLRQTGLCRYAVEARRQKSTEQKTGAPVQYPKAGRNFRLQDEAKASDRLAIYL